MRVIYVLNGPNLNLLGLREPDIYGRETLSDVENLCQQIAEEKRYRIVFFQSNSEGELIEKIHEARGKAAAIIINPAAYSHTSIALLDALKCFEGLVGEVHISNIYQREPFRHQSCISLRADFVITGCGITGYGIAVEYLTKKLDI